MKHLIRIICAALLFAVVSCQDDDPTPNTGGTTPNIVNNFSLKLDGNTSSTNEVLAGQGEDEGTMVILAQKTPYLYSIYIDAYPNNITAGTTYAFDDEEGNFSIQNPNDETYYLFAQDGGVTITSIDTVNNKVTGTFSATMLNTETGAIHTVTNGSFNAPYTN